MTALLHEALDELNEKSPFVRTSCDRPATINLNKHLSDRMNSDYHDRFSEATKVEGEKTAFACESCGHH